MFGAILGDIIGSPFEFDRGNKSKNFELFTKGCEFTDDTVMTIAVAEALMDVDLDSEDDVIRERLVKSLKKWGKKYPDAGYGARFSMWLTLKNTEPYNSCGNGSAMRVAPAGWLARSLEEARRLARLSAEVTHNHLEGIKGAEAVACAIYMGRMSFYKKEEIRDYIVKEFGYDLSRTCDEIRPEYYHTELCQQTVPEAITAFLEGEDFEDVIRTAVSLGGDCDTLTCIAGSMAEAYYGVPADLKYECYQRLDDDLRKVLGDFELRCQFDEDYAYKYAPLYWFIKNEDGIVQLQRPFTEPVTFDESMEMFNTSTQALDGWRRAKLYMEAFGIWDATAFAATMGATFAFGPFVDESGEDVILTFTTCQTADRTVYNLLDKKAVETSREYVDTFYNIPRMQLDWEKLILHPVVMKVYSDGRIEPVFIGAIDPKKINMNEFEIYRFETN